METGDYEFELIDYIEVILKRKWLILLGTLACLAGVYLYCRIMDSSIGLYSAKAQIFISPSMTQTIKDTQVEVPTLTPEFYKSVALSDELRIEIQECQKTLIDSLDLKYDIAPLVLDAQVIDKVSLEMKACAVDTALARNILYAWVDSFFVKTGDLSITESARYYTYVTAQYDAARNNLDQIENKIMQFNKNYAIDFLQSQLATYQGQLKEKQPASILAYMQYVEKENQYQHILELVRGLEIDGVPIHRLSAAELARQDNHPSTELAQRLIKSIGELEQLKLEQDSQEKAFKLELLNFDREHDYGFLGGEISSLEATLNSYQGNYQQLLNNDKISLLNLRAIEEEIKKHPPTVQSFIPEERGKQQKNLSTITGLNPIYMGLDSLRAQEGLNREKTKLYLEAGKSPIGEMAQRLDEFKKKLYSLQLERQQLLDRQVRQQALLKERLESAQATFDAIKRTYLENKKTADSLELELTSLKRDIAYQDQVLAEMENKVQELQTTLDHMLIEKARLDRDKQIYSSSVDKFRSLSEDARIARQKANTNLRLITKDVMAKPEDSGRSKKLLIGAGVGLALSTFIAFLLEYVRRARARRPLAE